MSDGEDRRARERALDPQRSFIVQAPAGSGKTELLIQRYLTLLRTVEQPEQVIAITFTRKAAAEMRARVLEALRAASADAPAGAPHRERTLAIANGVLSRDRELDWSLLGQPYRLRIDTLDALNAWLAQQLPVLAGGVADAELTEDAEPLYRMASRRVVARLAEHGAVGKALRTLLRAPGVSVERLEDLLAALLPSRDQWLRHVAVSDERAFYARAAAGFDALLHDHMLELETLLGPERVERLAAIARHAARHAAATQTRDALAVWVQARALPAETAARLEAWRGIANLLLTRDGRWRRKLGKNEGFGPEHEPQKAALAALHGEIASDDGVRAALASLCDVPAPDEADASREDLGALRVVLPQLVAELRVMFAERRTVDFVELAIAAEHALGQVEAPSDLLLAIDRRIRHVLVDEFQDTSHAQLRLLKLLTAGWMPGDGRSLFLVGDPMQSIYRFRDADMSLFLRAKQRGIGEIPLEPLVLERNFRSAPAIVAWSNRAFAGIFPDRDRPDLGIARFYACAAVRPAGDRQLVELHAVRSPDHADEIARAADVVERERAASDAQSIAVLVQSRTHLRGLHQELGARGLAAHALEIESPAQTEIGRDLIGLTRALAHPADRIAWLGVLHAPWCGLGWRDLHALCADAGGSTVWEMLHDAVRLARLSGDGRDRACAVRDVLAHAQSLRARTSFARWVEAAWRMLDGPLAAGASADLDAARQFFADLETLTRDGDLDDPPALERFFAHARRQADPGAGPGVEIMTVHRAKGLEFDTVVVLGLARRVRGASPAALHWQERPRPDGTTALLLAPASRANGRAAYLQRTEQQRDLAERARLLYVAATRARERLHLVARLPPGRDTPMHGTWLALVWPQFAQGFSEARPLQPAGRAPAAPAQLPLKRFADGFAPPAARAAHAAARPRPPTAARYASRPAFEWAGYAAVQVGTIVHRYLQVIAETGLGNWNDAAIEAVLPRTRRELEAAGVSPDELSAATARVRAALRAVLRDRRARWILARRPEATAELRLTSAESGRLEHLQLDRTFVDASGTRWIIDYKTSSHEGGDVEAFMDAEVERYRGQLERYARALACIEARPVRVGLYFPLLARFRHWAPDLGGSSMITAAAAKD